LGRAKLHTFVGVRGPSLLVEGEGVGQEVNRILQFLGRGLVRLLRTLGVSLEIDMHLTDGVDVVLEGRLAHDGTFRATTVLAKCASRYENAPEKYRSVPGYTSAPAAAHS